MNGGDIVLRRRVYLNDAPDVNLYSTEGGTNPGNCATGCTNCTSGGGGGFGPTVAAAGITATAIFVVATLGSTHDETM